MKLEISAIQKEELSLLMQEEAFKEGWSYSQEDVDFYYLCPQNFIYAVKVNQNLAGCVILHKSSSNLHRKPVFSAGFFLVLNEYRGQKTVGPYLWHHAITQHISEDSVVCFHAVPRAVDFYERLNFKKTALVDLYLTLKKEQLNDESMEVISQLFDNETLKKYSKNTQVDIEKYNNKLFPGDSGRGVREFVQQWLKRPDAIVIAYYRENNLQGYGVVTICKQASEKISYRISPLYADTGEVAEAILKGLIKTISEKPFAHIELNTLATSETEFGHLLTEVGFSESGKNIVVCNKPDLISKELPILQHIFCSIPLEYPHEVVSGLLDSRGPASSLYGKDSL